MPYIKQERRKQFDGPIHELARQMWTMGAVKGDLNYVVTRLALIAMKPGSGWTYQSLSEAVAGLQDAADEIKRRMLGPYEDNCVVRNGDIPEFSN